MISSNLFQYFGFNSNKYIDIIQGMQRIKNIQKKFHISIDRRTCQRK